MWPSDREEKTALKQFNVYFPDINLEHKDSLACVWLYVCLCECVYRESVITETADKLSLSAPHYKKRCCSCTHRNTKQEGDKVKKIPRLSYAGFTHTHSDI